jgi:hypothetical protein
MALTITLNVNNTVYIFRENPWLMLKPLKNRLLFSIVL